MRRSEDGFSLPEVLVTTMLLSIVALLLAQTMQSMTATAASTSRKSNSSAETQFAIEAITRDLRAANPINAIDNTLPLSTYDTKVSFEVFCSSGTGCVNNLRKVTYEVVGNSLKQTTAAGTRILIGPTDTAGLAVSLRRNAVLNTTAPPVFTYYDRTGTRIPTDGTRPATYFRDCTKQVQIHLQVRSDPNKPNAVSELKTSVNLRNHNEVNPC